MLENIISSFLLISSDGLKGLLHNIFPYFDHEQNNFRLISIYLIVIAIVIFVILVSVIYVKYFISLLKNEIEERATIKPKETMSSYVHLILDMLRRKVEIFKIAQTIKQISSNHFSEDEVLQTIKSIKGFIDLCNSSAVDYLEEDENPVSIRQVISELYDGDPSSSLVILDFIINDNIESTVRFEDTDNHDTNKSISNLAYIYGNLAALVDTNLAKNSFELSIQLNPDNFESWSRLADLMKNLKKQPEAVKMYKMIIKRANEKEYPDAVVNAHKQLFEIYKQNNDEMAEKYQGFEHYYDSIGISSPLSEEELHILDIFQERENKKEIIAMLMRG